MEIIVIVLILSTVFTAYKVGKLNIALGNYLREICILKEELRKLPETEKMMERVDALIHQFKI